MKKITFLIVFLITSVLGFTQNIVTNGDFSNGLNSWTPYLADFAGVSATINATNSEVNVTGISGAGGATWHIQLNQELTATQISSLTVGQSYKVTFSARGASARPLKLYFGENGGGFVAIHQQDFNLTTTNANYEATFSVGQTFSAMKLGFEAGLSNVDFFIDNVTLELVQTPPPGLDLITNFETAPDLASWDGAVVSNGTDPQSGGTRGMNMKMDVSAGIGQFWQGAKVTFLNNNLMNLSTNKTVMVDIYSTTPRTIMAKVESGSGAPASADDENHGGTGWETITFTFTTGADGTATANGNYNVLAFFANRNGSGGWTNPWASSTLYFDNVYAVKYVAPADPAPTTSAPNPTHANADVVLSYFNDKPGFTSAYGAEGEFGTRTLINLDAENDQTIKMNFGVAGWGQYNNTTVDITAANYFHFDYYVPTLAAGANGHGFWIMLNSGSGEKQYRVEAANIVFDSWQTISVPMTHFTNLGFNKATLLSWKLGSDSDLNTKFVYFDNIYFTVNTLNNDSFTKNIVSIYPNPTSNILNIEAPSAIQSLSVVNLLGQEVISRNASENMISLDVSNLQAGIYIIKTSVDGNISSTKFIKE